MEGGPVRLAVIRELSVTGAQVLSQARHEAGEHLTLALHFEPEQPAREVKARVVRTERWTEPGVWSFLVIVEFESPLTDLVDEIRVAAENCDRIFGSRT